MRKYLFLLSILTSIVIPTMSVANQFTVNSVADDSDANLNDNLCLTPGGACTLRAAIEQANALLGIDEIRFNIAGAGPHLIQPVLALPSITEATILDATDEFDVDGNPRVVLDGTNAPSSGLVIASGNHSQNPHGSFIRGFVIQNFTSNFSHGIQLQSGNDTTVEYNRIGTNYLGTADAGNYVGIFANSDDNKIIGNLISGNTLGIDMSSGSQGNYIKGNIIGADGIGINALPNLTGIIVRSSNHLVTGNLISGNDARGVTIQTNSPDNQIISNKIGTDIFGTNAIGNCGNPGNIICSSVDSFSPGTIINENLISGNQGNGILLTSAADESIIQWNKIGTDNNEDIALGNDGAGIYVSSSDNLIQNNLIAHSKKAGIFVSVGSNLNAISQNSIFENDELGIDRFNNLQNAPTVGAVELNGANGESLMKAGLTSPSGNYRIEFFSSPTCDPSGFGEGKTFLGAVDTVSIPAGSLSVIVDFSTAPKLIPGHFVTATATLLDSNGELVETSEFSKCVEVIGYDLDSDGTTTPSEPLSIDNPTQDVEITSFENNLINSEIQGGSCAIQPNVAPRNAFATLLLPVLVALALMRLIKNSRS